MEAVFQISLESILADLPAFTVIAGWNLFVILFLSIKVYQTALKKGMSINSSMYFSRKVIHFLAGGLTAMLLPFVAHEPALPAATAFGLALKPTCRTNSTGECTGSRTPKTYMMWILH